MRIDVGRTAGTPICAGAVNGRELLIRMLDQVKAEPAKPQLLFLDFSHVEVATVSFLREGVLGLRHALRLRRSLFRPVIVNANEAVAEEVAEAAEARGESLPSATIGDHDTLSEVIVLGRLDPSLEKTLRHVVETRATTAAELHDRFCAEEPIKQTAWNNRLAALEEAGLVVQTLRGRVKVFSPLSEVI